MIKPAELRISADAPDTGIRTVDDMRKMMEAFGMKLTTTHPDEVAQTALQGVRDGKFWILPLNPGTEARIKERMDSILNRTNPPIPTLG